MNNTVADLIRCAGGVDAIASASRKTRKPVSPDAVHKWRRNGIPDEHWGIFVDAGIDVASIYSANEKLRSSASLRKRVKLRVA